MSDPVSRYYRHRDQIALQRLQELVSDLYLAEGKKRQQLWQYVSSHLAQLGVPQSQIDHLCSQDNVELLGKLVKKLWDQGSWAGPGNAGQPS